MIKGAKATHVRDGHDLHMAAVSLDRLTIVVRATVGGSLSPAIIGLLLGGIGLLITLCVRLLGGRHGQLGIVCRVGIGCCCGRGGRRGRRSVLSRILLLLVLLVLLLLRRQWLLMRWLRWYLRLRVPSKLMATVLWLRGLNGHLMVLGLSLMHLVLLLVRLSYCRGRRLRYKCLGHSLGDGDGLLIYGRHHTRHLGHHEHLRHHIRRLNHDGGAHHHGRSGLRRTEHWHILPAHLGLQQSAAQRNLALVTAQNDL